MVQKPGIFVVSEAPGSSAFEAQRVAAALIAGGYRVRTLARSSSARAQDLTFAARAAFSLWQYQDQYDLVCFFGGGPHLGPALATAWALRKSMAAKFFADGIFSAMSRTALGQFELGWFRDWEVPLILPDERMALQAEAAGFPGSQLTTIPPLVDTDVFHPPSPGEIVAARSLHGIPAQAKVILYTGRLASERGLPDLIHGAALASQSDPATLLVLAGHGPARRELETLAKQFDPSGESCRFLGVQPHAAVPSLMAAADISVRTSAAPGSALSLLEAMATGLPSVVSVSDGHLQFIQNQIHGVTVPAAAPQALGAALATLLADPGLRHRLGAAARQRVLERWSVAAVLPRYEALFAKARPARTSLAGSIPS